MLLGLPLSGSPPVNGLGFPPKAEAPLAAGAAAGGPAADVPSLAAIYNFMINKF